MMKLFSLLLFLWALSTLSYADGDIATSPAPELSAEEIKVAADKKKRQSAIDSLESTQLALTEKQAELKALQRQLKSADSVQKVDIQAELDEVSLEVKSLKTSFEQVAIGGISLEGFESTEQIFDWKQELVLITKPVLESLKDLTEKPRNLERFRSTIADREVRAAEINKAIASLEVHLAEEPPATIVKALDKTLEEWKSKQKDNVREMESVQVQLDNLLGSNTPWYQTVVSSLQYFFSGRGKTLLIAVLVSVLIWQGMKGLLWVIRKRSKSSKSARQRIIVYLYKFLTTLMIFIAAMVVFYTRGDLLLLALMIIVFVGVSFAVRSYLPNYILEAKTLLDLGTVREEELVIYNGIPWQVYHINVQSILRNPEIYGVLRVPLSELVSFKSRPAGGDENWFPCRKGDLLLMPDGAMAEVLRQTPDSVELQSKGGMRLSHPTATVFEMGFYNLTRGDSYSAISVFGIDYAHVDISLTEVPECFKVAIDEGLRQAGLGEHVIDVLVDFKEANSSSLDYLIVVTMSSRAASSYFKAGRVIQQSCVRACTENSWGIPFPQLMVHRTES